MSKKKRFLTRGHATYIHQKLKSVCRNEIKQLGRGGQSIIFSCDDEILKVYKRPWSIDLQEMEIKLKVLNKFDFVPRTGHFYSFGFKQQQVIGRKKRELSPLQFEELGQKLAKIHTTVKVKLKRPTSCNQNTGNVLAT